MKKGLIALLLCLFVLPLTVNADRNLNGEILLYSEQATVGSDVVFRITASCDNDTCDGTLKYDSSVLEYKSISYNYPLKDVGPSNGTVKITSNENGSLSYDFNDPDINGSYMPTSIMVTFTIKAAPSSGQIEVTYMPSDGTSLIESQIVSKVINVKESSTTTCNCPKCDNDSQTTTVDNQDDNKTTECNCKNEETTNTTTTGESKCEKDNTWFIIGIVSLIFNALFLIIILLISKKKNTNKVANEENKELENKQE